MDVPGLVEEDEGPETERWGHDMHEGVGTWKLFPKRV